MALSAEAVIAIVGVLINLPTFVLVFWDMWAKRRRRSISPYREARPDSSSHEEYQLSEGARFYHANVVPWAQQPSMLTWYAPPWAAPRDYESNRAQ